MHSPPKSRELSLALHAARQAAEIIRSYAGQVAVAKKKVGEIPMGLVTKADVDAERCIVRIIQDTFPDHVILAEESHSQSQDSDELWVIDPLDGTNNFAHDIPHYSVSIAYRRNQITRCGVVLNVATEELFYAQHGQGAWFNDRPARVNQHGLLSEAILGTGFYYDRGKMMRATLATIQDLFENDLQGIRRFGSAALDLAYVGIGRFGGYFEYQLAPWDYAAGKLFVEEAGGTVSDCLGCPIPLQTTTILATNHLLHDRLLQITEPHARSLVHSV